MYRALELTGLRILQVDWNSTIFRSLDPKKNLNFKSITNEITVLHLKVKMDPIRFLTSWEMVKHWIVRDERLYYLLKIQYCYDIDNLFNMDSIIPPFKKLISAKDWAHLFTHLSLIHAQFAVMQPITPEKMFEERSFYNPANPSEICVVYNYPLRLGEFGTYLEHLQNYMQSLLGNTPDPNFLQWLEDHRAIYDQSVAQQKSAMNLNRF